MVWGSFLVSCSILPIDPIQAYTNIDVSLKSIKIKGLDSFKLFQPLSTSLGPWETYTQNSCRNGTIKCGSGDYDEAARGGNA